MTRYTAPALVLLLAAGSWAQLPADSSPWRCLVVGRQSTPERLATVDLQRYIGQVTGVCPAVVPDARWLADRAPAVLLGTPTANRALRALNATGEGLGEQGYRLARLPRGSLGAWGASDEGAVNAIYGLLREVGFGFYLGSEAAPDALPATLPLASVTRTPALRVRGVLPWYNFLNSPTTWDPTDHRALVDQLIRMGANFVGFHTYDGEPFAAYEEDGTMVWGSRLLSTTSSLWGTSPLPTDRFGFGTGLLYPADAFGAETALAQTPGSQAVLREQAVVRDAVQYAHDRGLRTCLGFELSGDPTEARWREPFVRRLEWILDHYPALDYMWLWQSETMGASGYSPRPAPRALPDGRLEGSRMPLYGLDRRDEFARVVERSSGERPFFVDSEEGRLARATEGARLEQFALLAGKILGRREHHPRLVISGWGGDDRILSAEYYEGLDRLLPGDVVFSSLEHIAARERVDGVYHDLGPERERWPIPWLECDGDQWHAQPRVHSYEALMRDLVASGSQGVLGIHWRTRDVDENMAYITQAAWDPSLTAEGFFADYALRVYGPALGPRMAAIHSELDRMGYRWVGGGGQNECAPFSWGPGEPPKAARLAEIRAEVASMLPEAGARREPLAWLMDSIDWVLAYDRAERGALEASSLLGRARGADDEEARRLAGEALAALDRAELSEALWAYARRVTTRGEYGVLATVNTKALIAWRALRAEAASRVGSAPEEAPTPPLAPAIVLPRRIGCVDAGAALVLEPYVLGGGSAWLHYRSLGASTWRSRRMASPRGWVRRGTVPSEAVSPPGLELAFSFSRDPVKPLAFGPVRVTVLPARPRAEGPWPRRTYPGATLAAPTLEATDAGILRIAWGDLPAASYYRVLRDGVAIGETVVPNMPDAPLRLEGAYAVEAWDDAKMLARSAPTAYRTPEVPLTERPEVSARANRLAVLLTWPRCTSPGVAWYGVRRSPADGSAPEAEVTRVVASRVGDHWAKDTPAPGRWLYRVVPISPAGREGSGTETQVEFVPGAVPEPVLALPLRMPPAGAEAYGNPVYGTDGVRCDEGWLRLAHRPEWNLGQAWTLELTFRADDVSAMPVLLSHGAWQVDGWFVQILGARLLVRTPQGDAVGPAIEPGIWYAARFVYDGLGFRVWVNGSEIPQPAGSIADVPCARDLIVGQYESQQDSFTFRGVLRDIRLWADAVPPE